MDTSAFRLALQQGLCGKSVVLHDLDLLASRVEAIRSVFPPGTLHAVAVKANPLVRVLRFLVECGCGLEAASWEEVALARAAGCPAGSIVFDSPAKTEDELREALSLGLRLNADNFAELDRIHRLGPGNSRHLGLRVNPEVGEGSIALTSVSQKGSKFGTPLSAVSAELFERYPWLNGLHLHVGSQGCPVSMLADGVAAVWKVALGFLDRLAFFDLGGGLGVDYRHDGTGPSPAEYAAALRSGCPGLLEGRLPLVTEFGRWIQAPTAWACSRVEYVKDGPTVILHLGADMFLRKAYHPDQWHHVMKTLSPDGSVKEGDPVPCTVAGPLCFGGDILGREVSLVLPSPGDWVAIADVGAYTMGMWSRHCSRALPGVLGWEKGAWRVLKEPESLGDVVRFWS